MKKTTKLEAVIAIAAVGAAAHAGSYQTVSDGCRADYINVDGRYVDEYCIKSKTSCPVYSEIPRKRCSAR